jgi:hypothetical protein
MPMKITHANVDEMNSHLMDILDDTGGQVRDAAETWLDTDNEADERREAREVLDEQIPVLAEQLRELLNVIE